MANILITTLSDTTLRTAIANASAGDTITFDSSLANGTLTLSGGELVIDKALTIDGETNNITIDAAGASRVFNVDDGTSTEVNVVINGLTITGGSVVGDGGGIFNDENLTITDSTISDNQATVGFADGAGIFNDGTLTVTDSTITGNSANDNGGAIYTDDGGTTTISGSVIDGNTSNNDGGGLFNFGTVTITNTDITNNQALSNIYADGGGVAVFGNTTITDSTISGNFAGDDGGGVYVKDVLGNLTITDTTISGNTAGSDGGGVFNFGTTTITDSIITQNEARDEDSTGGGGGIASFGSTGTTSTTVTSSFVAGNANNSDVEFVTQNANSFSSGGNNQIGKGNAIGAFNATGDETGVMPGVTITETDGSTDITEGGDIDTYEVVLDSQPTDEVTVTITPDDQSTTDVMTLTFDETNWNVAQTVTVTAVDDTLIEGDHTSTISHTVTGAIEYDGLTIDDITANITDNSNPLLGTSGNDTLIGGQGNDEIDGLGGDDLIEGRTGDDRLFGNGGSDTVNGQAGDDEIFGGNGIDSLLGGSGNDTVFGDNNADTLIGNEGQDSLLGGNGGDRLAGGFDNDTLDGGAGVDVLIGNDGADSFVLRPGDRNDTINDYDDGTDNFLLDGASVANLTFTQSGVDTVIRYTDPTTLDTEKLATLSNINFTVLDETDFLSI